MIAVHIMGGIGNQLFQYAFARAVALKNNVELKLEIFECEQSKNSHHNYYRLGDFNIVENFATADEVKQLTLIKEDAPNFSPALLENMDNILFYGYFQEDRCGLASDCYFSDAEEIIRREITPKNPFGQTAEFWKQKILSAECAVSLHIRHGDFLAPYIRYGHGILPMDYYNGCIAQLKKDFPNLTVFVFSDDLKWAKNNFKLDVPMEFVEGCEKDVEELFLMSYCKHNIAANSTFSWWSAWLNQNPDKKVFVPRDIKKFPMTENQGRYLPKNFIEVPVDYSKRGHVEFPPLLSVILYLENDAATINLTLNSILTQAFKEFELIIIDASTDDSGDLCRNFAGIENVSVFRESHSINRFQAWNKGLNIASGDYIMFIDGKSYMMKNAFMQIAALIRMITYQVIVDKPQKYSNYDDYDALYPNIISSTRQLQEVGNENSASQDPSEKSFSMLTDEPFQNLERFTPLTLRDAQKCILLANQSINNSLCTKLFRRKFLNQFHLRFNEVLDSKDLTLQFLINAFMCADEIVFFPDIICGTLNTPPVLRIGVMTRFILRIKFISENALFIERCIF